MTRLHNSKLVRYMFVVNQNEGQAGLCITVSFAVFSRFFLHGLLGLYLSTFFVKMFNWRLYTGIGLKLSELKLF